MRVRHASSRRRAHERQQIRTWPEVGARQKGPPDAYARRVDIDPMTVAVRGRMGVLRVWWSRMLGRMAGLALATPLALGVVEILFRPWSDAAWLPVWRTALAGGIGSAIGLAIAGAVVAAIRPAREGLLRADGLDLVMEAGSSVRRTPLAAVASGVVVPRPNGTRVELELDSGNRLFAEVADVAHGQRLLEALGLDASKRRCTVPLEPRALSVMKRVGFITLGFFVTLGVLGAVTGGAPLTVVSASAMLASLTAATLLAVRVTRPREITIGADGLRLDWRGGRRFLPLDTLSSVRADGQSIELSLRDGRRETIRLPRGANRDGASAIALRIDQAIRAHLRAPDAQARLDLLSRSGRSLEQWRAALGKLTERAEGYRAAGLSGEDLAAIVQNPASSREHRMGAALALASVKDAAQKDRLRIAADACASEPMRIALGKLSDGEVDERAVEEALAGSEATEAVRTPVS